MATFTDAKNKDWEFRLTVGSLERWKNKHGTDPLDIDLIVGILHADPIQSCAIMRYVLEPQFANASINAGLWIEEQNGKTAKAAQVALLEEYLAFFTDAGMGKMVEAHIALRQQMQEQATEQVQQAFGALSGDAQA